jgi:predicted ATPase
MWEVTVLRASACHPAGLCLGFPHQALAQSNEAITEARRLAHPTSLAVSFTLGALPLWLVGDNAALGKRAAELVGVATEQGFALWGAQGTIYRGWVEVEQGDVTEGISLLRSGSAAATPVGRFQECTVFLPRSRRCCGPKPATGRGRHSHGAIFGDG